MVQTIYTFTEPTVDGVQGWTAYDPRDNGNIILTNSVSSTPQPAPYLQPATVAFDLSNGGGSFDIEYSVQDTSGNETIVTRTVTVINLAIPNIVNDSFNTNWGTYLNRNEFIFQQPSREIEFDAKYNENTINNCIELYKVGQPEINFKSSQPEIIGNYNETDKCYDFNNITYDLLDIIGQPNYYNQPQSSGTWKIKTWSNNKNTDEDDQSNTHVYNQPNSYIFMLQNPTINLNIYNTINITFENVTTNEIVFFVPEGYGIRPNSNEPISSPNNLPYVFRLQQPTPNGTNILFASQAKYTDSDGNNESILHSGPAPSFADFGFSDAKIYTLSYNGQPDGLPSLAGPNAAPQLQPEYEVVIFNQTLNTVVAALLCGETCVDPVDPDQVTLLDGEVYNITHEAGTPYIEGGFNAIDCLNVAIAENNKQITKSNSMQPDSMKHGENWDIYYTATDVAENVSQVTKQIEVIDSIPPTIEFQPNINTIERVTQPSNCYNQPNGTEITLQPSKIPYIIFKQPENISLPSDEDILNYVTVYDIGDNASGFITTKTIESNNIDYTEIKIIFQPPYKTIIKLGTYEIEYESKDGANNTSSYKLYRQVRFRTFLEDLELCILSTRKNNPGFMSRQKARYLSDELLLSIGYQQQRYIYNDGNTTGNPVEPDDTIYLGSKLQLMIYEYERYLNKIDAINKDLNSLDQPRSTLKDILNLLGSAGCRDITMIFPDKSNIMDEIKEKSNKLISLMIELKQFIRSPDVEDNFDTDYSTGNKKNGIGYNGYVTMYLIILNKILVHFEWLNEFFYKDILQGLSAINNTVYEYSVHLKNGKTPNPYINSDEVDIEYITDDSPATLTSDDTSFLTHMKTLNNSVANGHMIFDTQQETTEQIIKFQNFLQGCWDTDGKTNTCTRYKGWGPEGDQDLTIADFRDGYVHKERSSAHFIRAGLPTIFDWVFYDPDITPYDPDITPNITSPKSPPFEQFISSRVITELENFYSKNSPPNFDTKNRYIHQILSYPITSKENHIKISKDYLDPAYNFAPYYKYTFNFNLVYDKGVSYGEPNILANSNTWTNINDIDYFFQF